MITNHLNRYVELGRDENTVLLSKDTNNGTRYFKAKPYGDGKRYRWRDSITFAKCCELGRQMGINVTK